MIEKRLIQVAKVYSAILSPFFATGLAFLWLMFFSYLRIFSSAYKWTVMLTLLTFTLVIPRVSIGVLRRMNRWTRWQLGHREHRHLPYVLTLMSYAACLLLFIQMHAPSIFRSILLAAIIALVICFAVNQWWKISTHMVGAGGLTGMLIAFSMIFFYNPLWPLCLFILLSGLLGTCRMVLRQHSLAQVLWGYAVGFCVAIFTMLFLWVP